MNFLYYLVIFFVVINVIAFLLMWVDKGKAQKTGKRRISEGMMFFMATIFGSIGVYIGMFAFRHKTAKWYFLIGIPMLFLQNISLLYVTYIIYTELL